MALSQKFPWLLAGLVLLGALPGPVRAMETVPGLAGVTVVRATTTASTLVELNRPAELVVDGGGGVPRQ